VTVLRRGRVVLDRPAAALTRDEVARAVVGGELQPLRGRARDERANGRGMALEVTGLECDGVRALSLHVRAGEILGIAGVEGNGQRALLEAIAGIRATRAGRIAIGDRDITSESALGRRQAGLGFVPEDREETGLCATLSIAENLALGDPSYARGDGWLSPDALRARARSVIERYAIRPDDPDLPVRALSGGNAQKVLVARELERPLTALLLAQPTRGVDLGAATAIRQHILDARARGLGVLLVSSELDELRALSDRIAVLFRGKLVTEMPVEAATDEQLGPWMIGAHTERAPVTASEVRP
jgi:simple sugar transport system ATP-binding protein